MRAYDFIQVCYNRIRQQDTTEVHMRLLCLPIVVYVAGHDVVFRLTHCFSISMPHKGKGTSWYMACPLFLCPVYARQGRVYNIDQTKKAAEARPFRGTLIHGDCTAWISVPFFVLISTFSASRCMARFTLLRIGALL